MKSPVVKRSIVIAGHKTSVSLEDAFWDSLKEIAAARDKTLSDVVASIDNSAARAIFRPPSVSTCSITSGTARPAAQSAKRVNAATDLPAATGRKPPLPMLARDCVVQSPAVPYIELTQKSSRGQEAAGRRVISVGGDQRHAVEE